MKKTGLFLFLLFLLCYNGFSQTIQVNPDGTHTVIINQGSKSIQVNPDGSHTIILHNENTSAKINPDGTHSVIHHNNNTSTEVNPDGTHTQIINYETHSVVIHPDGSQTYVANPPPSPESKRKASKKVQAKLNENKVRNEAFNEHISKKPDSPYFATEEQMAAECKKIVSVHEQQLINEEDFSFLMIRIINRNYNYYNPVPDRISEIKKLLDAEVISPDQYDSMKNRIIYGEEAE
jgi:hypothetical protein